MQRVAALAALLVQCFAAAGAAAAQPTAPEDASAWRASAGVRLWAARWDSWNVNPIATGVAVGDDRYEVVESRRGNQKLAAVPFASLRYGGFFVSASAMTTTDYTLSEAATPGGFEVQSSRSERDLNLGYVFSTGIGITLGSKQIDQRFGPDKYRWRGPVLGLSASSSLAGSWGMYTSVGLGSLKARFPIADIDGRTRFDTAYGVVETGLTYAIPSPTSAVRSLVLTAGYRAQRVATRDYALAVIPSTVSAQAPRRNTSGDLVDTTQGLVIGLQGSF
jgi:hypothetical protein